MIFMICIKSYFRQDFCTCDRSHVCTHWRLLSAVMIYRIEIDIPKAFISYSSLISHNTLSLLLILVSVSDIPILVAMDDSPIRKHARKLN